MTEIRQRVRIHVTEAMGHRHRPVETGDALTDALAAHVQRVVCEGARAAWSRSPASQQWMEQDTGQAGWRAQVRPDTLHLIHVLEELGWEFDDA